MTPGPVTEVMARIGEIQSRFAPPPGFASQLAQAQGADAPQPAPAPAFRAAGVAGSGGTAGGTLAPVFQPATANGARAASAAPAGGSGAPGAWAAKLPAAGRQWAPAIQKAATEAGVEPELLAGLVWAESNFNAGAGSHAGAIGLAQLMPGTARGLGVDPHDPQQNLLGGARYLRAQLDRFGSKELALAAYNAGPGRVSQAGGIPRIAETQAYVPKVLGYYAQLR